MGKIRPKWWQREGLSDQVAAEMFARTATGFSAVVVRGREGRDRIDAETLLEAVDAAALLFKKYGRPAMIYAVRDGRSVHLDRVVINRVAGIGA